jgi:outer membrane protein
MMTNILKHIAAATLAGAMAMGASAVQAGDYMGNFMIRAGVSVIAPDSSADVFAANGGQIAGADAEVSTEVVPTATISYFFTENIAAELLCCFAKHEVEGKGTLAGVDLGDTWIFPPAVTLQYHSPILTASSPMLVLVPSTLRSSMKVRRPGLLGPL